MNDQDIFDETKDSSSNDSGSVWTSYSDLFTTMAIIFLIMFVFALIKSGVSTMQTVMVKKENQEYLEGKIPEEMLNKVNQKTANLELAIKDFDGFKNVIDKKLIEINTISQKLSEQRDNIKDILKDQKTKEALVAHMKEKLRMEKSRTVQLSTEIKELKQSIQAKGQQIESQKEQKNILNNELVKIKKAVSIQTGKIQQLKEQMEIKNNSIAQLQSKIEDTNKAKLLADHQLKNEIEKSNKLNGQVQSINNVLAHVKNQLNEVNQSYIMATEKIDNFQQKLYEKDSQINEMNKKLAHAQSQTQNLNINNKSLTKEIINNKNKLDKLQSVNKQYEAQITGLIAEKKNTKNEIIGLKNINDDLSKQLNKSKNQINHLSALSKKLASENESISNDFIDIEQKYDHLKGQNQNLIKENAKIGELHNTINKLTSNNSQLMGANMELGQQLGKAKEKSSNLSTLSNTLSTLNDELSNEYLELEGKHNQLKVSAAKIKQLNENLTKENIKLSNNNNNFKNEVDKLNNIIHSKNTELNECGTEDESKLGDCKKGLASRDKKLEKLHQLIKPTIGHQIAQRLKNANLDVIVDPSTGNIVLPMDDVFLFQKNSYTLSSQAREKLKIIIPIYAEELFKNPEFKDKIASFNIIGHASPTYKKAFVDPQSSNPQAYQYNMTLSGQRALEIAKYIFSEDFGKFAYQSDLQLITQPSGRGLSSPIKKVGKVKDVCKEYDCKKSRRVEINFSLKEYNQQIQQLLK